MRAVKGFTVQGSAVVMEEMIQTWLDNTGCVPIQVSMSTDDSWTDALLIYVPRCDTCHDEKEESE